MNTAENNIYQIAEMREKYQIENGAFSKICNAIFEDLMCHHFAPAERQVIDCVIRFTYGYKVKTARLPLHFISEKTGLPIKRVSKSITSLLDKNVLFREGGQNGEIGYQKYAERWKIASSPKTENWASSPKTENSVLQKRRTQKMTPYKELKKTLNIVPTVLVETTVSTPDPAILDKKKQDRTPYADIVNLYHEVLPTLPAVKKLSAKRKSFIKARWNDGLPSLNHWREYFEYVLESKFLMGRIETKERKPFIADFEWIIRESNFIKVWEGRYHD